MNAADVMDEVVGRLLAAIEAGADTWDMPWRSIGSTDWPANAPPATATELAPCGIREA